MTPQQHVSALLENRSKVEWWLKRVNWKRCCECGQKAHHPWIHQGSSNVICDHCHPKCQEKGCHNLALMGGEGGCDEHEHLFWDKFQALVAGVA